VIKKNANVKPVSTTVFGGWIENRGKITIYNWKKEDAIKWAEEIGKLTN